MLGRENLIAREEVLRLQELRGTYGIKSPAPICPDPESPPGPAAGRLDDSGAATCQVVQAPEGGGLRLVPDSLQTRSGNGAGDGDGEIRLTYRQLSALIEDAVRQLRRE